MIQQRVPVPAVHMHLDPLRQQRRQDPVRGRHDVFLVLRLKHGAVALLVLLPARGMDGGFDVGAVEVARCARGIVEVGGIAGGADVVRVEAWADGGEVGERGAVGCAAEGTRGVDGGVDEGRGGGRRYRGTGGLSFDALLLNLALPRDVLSFLQEEVQAFGIAGDDDGAFGRVGQLGEHLVETAGAVCGGEGGEDGPRDFQDVELLVEVC